MFEYAALVDAPVQRFTGIVTGPDPVDDLIAPAPVAARVVSASQVAVASSTPSAELSLPAVTRVVQAPVLLAATDPDRIEPAAASVTAPPAAAPPAAAPPATTPPATAPAPVVAVRTSAPIAPRRKGPAPAPTRPSLGAAPVMPAIVGVAVAALTAAWWLRRDSHDRPR